VTDLETAGIPADDVREVLTIASRHKAVFDEINEPRLLHGDLWVPNLMLAPDDVEPRLSVSSTMITRHGAIRCPTGLSSWR
jgi:hypothetical protein